MPSLICPAAELFFRLDFKNPSTQLTVLQVQSLKTKHYSLPPVLSLPTLDHCALAVKCLSHCSLFSTAHPFFLSLMQLKLLPLGYRPPRCQVHLLQINLALYICWKNALWPKPAKPCPIVTPTVYGTKVLQTRPAFLFGLVFLQHASPAGSSDPLFHAGSEPLPPHPLGLFWFHTDQGTSLAILCAPREGSTVSWHLPYFPDIPRTICVPPELGCCLHTGTEFYSPAHLRYLGKHLRH